jgi:alanyl-tRNA synthetase
MVVQGVRSVFETDLFSPWRSLVPGPLVPGPLLPGRLDERSLRIVIDHLRSAIVVIGDGVRPSNTGRGYVLRRLVRRALTELWRYDGSLSLTSLPSALVLDTASRFGQSVDPALVTGALLAEQAKFRDLLERGRSLLPRLYPSGLLTESDYRYLHETHGLPRELVSELVTEMASSTS